VNHTDGWRQEGVFRATRLLGGRWLSRQRTTMTILNMYSARPILPALFAARYLSCAACPHQPVGARRWEPLANTARSLCKLIRMARSFWFCLYALRKITSSLAKLPGKSTCKRWSHLSSAFISFSL